jgi:malate dehydrogenase (quinone)
VTEACDVVLVGAGIMSATLGTLLLQLDPDISLQVFERLDRAASESSDAWNNAGTGHAAFCELNYTSETEDGSVDIGKAIRICEQYEQSKQFWAFLAEAGELPAPDSFVRRVPHVSFVWGSEDVGFLRRRYDSLQRSPLFAGMQYSEDRVRIAEWIPLVMAGREDCQPVAATQMSIGNDVNFGRLTRSLIEGLARRPQVAIRLHHEVRDLVRQSDGRWRVSVCDLATGELRVVQTRFVFIGAGGGALRLLEKSGVAEGAGYGGFPVSGQWLRCKSSEVVEQHHAKVYGKAAVGAPPMSVPHLDSRYIDSKRQLLFGPYAGFSTKFLKEGSHADLFRSLSFDNIVPMLQAGINNFDLTRYLVGQVLLSPKERMDMLRRYFPAAADEDWELEIAGQRVQIIKDDGKGGGVLKFGTEIVTASDGSLAALLGASPGASTAASIMLRLLELCFSERFYGDAWQRCLRTIFPSFGRSLHTDARLCKKVRSASLERLGLI